VSNIFLSQASTGTGIDSTVLGYLIIGFVILIILPKDIRKRGTRSIVHSGTRVIDGEIVSNRTNRALKPIPKSSMRAWQVTLVGVLIGFAVISVAQSSNIIA
jgi:hypothetical protein